MIGVLASRTVYRVFEPRSGQTKDYKIGISWFSTKLAALGDAINTDGEETAHPLG
jgi:hypothetical protein